MVVGEANINNIMGGIENAGGVRLHNHRKKLKQRFDIIKKLGQGTYGKVQLGINKETGQEVAIKTIKKCKIETEADLIRIRREIQIMSSVQHPNIIHIYEVFENREKMVLVMEYAAGGELYDYLSERKVLSEDEARRIFRQISIAVYYCHKHKICHRDLKLENILLDEHGNAKIADFGLSNIFDDTRLLSTFCGSPLYASPEIVKGTPYHGPEVDCWSLGVLLYTLVYGAMPFDGSNFKRLVKQISQGDYFEPKNLSPASPLIREMLTVAPNRRANMEKICSHWWVNESYKSSCLEVAEELANQTPVRLDLLLTLVPPPPQVGSDKLVIANSEIIPEEAVADALMPTRSMSVGSIMDRGPSQQKIRDIVAEEKAPLEKTEGVTSPKRKLEVTVSTENANQAVSGAKRKERSRKKDRDSSSDRRVSHRSPSRSKQEKTDVTTKSVENESIPDTQTLPEVTPNQLVKNLTQTMDVEVPNGELPVIEPLDDANTAKQEAGAMCTELIEEASQKATINKGKPQTEKLKKVIKVKKPKVETSSNKGTEETENEVKITDKIADKENELQKVSEPEEKSMKNDADVTKVIKKKVLGDKNDITPDEKPHDDITSEIENKTNKAENGEVKSENGEQIEEVAQPPTKSIERRRSKIFETAEKFQNMGSTENKSLIPEKPKKIFIPGVNVGGFKQAFERKASLTNSSPVKSSLIKKTVTPTTETKSKETKSKESNEVSPKEEIATQKEEKSTVPTETISSVPVTTSAIATTVSSTTTTTTTATMATTTPPADKPADESSSEDQEKREKLKKAVSVISNAIDREGARKSRSRPTMIRKPPVPFGAGGRSASGGITQLSSIISPPSDSKRLLKLQVGPEMRTASVHVTTPEDTKYITETLPERTNENQDENVKKSSIEVNLKSATLPRRKTSKAEITLNYPQPKPAVMEFITEMQHPIGEQPRLKTQRSEVSFPVSAVPKVGLRSTSLEPETKEKARERIIPIAFEKDEVQSQAEVRSPPTKPPAPRMQRTTSQGQRSGSVSRQSTQDSDTDSTSTQQEPIRKSPREYIIPIAIEGGGYVTPRAGSLEPGSESGTPTSKFSSGPRFNSRHRRMNSLLSDRDGSEDESSFTTLHHRHGSVGRDSDNEDSRKDRVHLHRLRSSRPTKRLEHADSLSSGEEDDDDGFELLTAENLFSTLLSRVRSLTQRLNVEDGGRTGFPSSRLLSHFGRDNFWDNFHREPFRNSFGRSHSREKESSTSRDTINEKAAPWRRPSTNRFSSESESTSSSHTLPRDLHHQNTQDLNLSDLDLTNLKLSDKDAVALSYLTPSLSRRIQKQLLSQLPPSQAKKLSRTLSMQVNKINEQAEIAESTENDETSSDLVTNVDQLSEKSKVESQKVKKPCNSAFSNVKSTYLSRRAISDDPTYKSPFLEPNSLLTYHERSKSPFSESSRSEYTDLSSRSDNIDYQNILPSIHNTDLTESDRKLLENYRKSREQRRAVRSNSLLDTNRNPYYRSQILESENDRSVLSKYFSTPSSYSSSDSLKSRTSSLSDYTSDYLKSKTLDRRSTGTAPRKVSRFLRPDFYDTPIAESAFAKEKNVRELETQKVLKEIRDKRLKRRLGIKEPLEHESSSTDHITNTPLSSPNSELSPTLSSPPSTTGVENKIDISATRSKISKLIRPKSYTEKKESSPTPKTEVKTNKINLPKDSSPKQDENIKTTEKTDSNKTKKNVSPQKVINPTGNDEKSSENKSNKNKFLQSLEKKFEKLRSLSNSSVSTINNSNNSEEMEKISRVNNAIRKLREQSLPRTIEHPITESGLIKRAVSVEDLSTLDTFGTNTPKVSRKSVSKILNLFKKYENKDSNKSKKTENSISKKQSPEKAVENKTEKIDAKKVVKKIKESNTGDTTKAKSKIPSKPTKKEQLTSNKTKTVKDKTNTSVKNENTPSSTVNNSITPPKETSKPTQNNIETAKSQEICEVKSQKEQNNSMKTIETTEPAVPIKTTSKLPVFRRSIDLGESTKLSNITNNNESNMKEARKSLNIQINSSDKEQQHLTNNTNTSDMGKDNSKRKSLQLDFSKLPRLNLPPEMNVNKESTAAVTPTSSTKIDDGLLSPHDDSSCDNWSTSSPDYTEHSHASQSYTYDPSYYYCNSLLSPSGDENESVIDRIRRKSFYTRFNEKKKTRKSSLVGPGADYNIAYKTVPRRSSSLRDDTKIPPIEPLLPLSTFRLSSTDQSSSTKHLNDNDSYTPRKNSLLNNSSCLSHNNTPTYTSRLKTINLPIDRISSSSVCPSRPGVEDSYLESGNTNRLNSHHHTSSAPVNNISDANCNLLENNNDQTDH